MTDIINLPGWCVTNVDETAAAYHIEAKYEDPFRENECPYCQFRSLDLHGRLKRSYVDTPIHGRKVTLELRRQRFKCQRCKKTFYEEIPNLDDKHRMTGRLNHYIWVNAFRRTFTALADDVGVNEKTVRNIFREHVSKIDEQHVVMLPEVLGIDEIKLDHKYRCVLTDVKNRRMIDMLRNRDKLTLSNYLYKRIDRECVKLVCMDMWNPYRDMISSLLPQAKIIVDKFHFVRMADEALNKLRKQYSATLTPAQRRRLMHDRFLLLKRRKDLSEKDKFILDVWLKNVPLLARAYALKEELHEIFYLTNRTEAENRYKQWREFIKDDLLQGFAAMLVAGDNWHDEIFAYFDYGFTNAYTESLNGLTKLTNRMGRGYSFEVIRAKMLYPHAAQSASCVCDGEKSTI